MTNRTPAAAAEATRTGEPSGRWLVTPAAAADDVSLAIGDAAACPALQGQHNYKEVSSATTLLGDRINEKTCCKQARLFVR
jgi:hypothetical protein